MITLLWIAVAVLFLVDVWLASKIGGLIGQVGRLEYKVKASMAGKLLPPDTSDPGSRV